MLNLACTLSRLPEMRGHAAWPGHEYVKGWGVFALPFDSGHVLGLRVFPENDFAPYRTIWHRDPSGRWAIYVDGPRLDTACPRYYGAACERTANARIDVAWTGPASLRLTMDPAALSWTLTARTTVLLEGLNAIAAALPLRTWRPRALLRARESLARALGDGLSRTLRRDAEGHVGTLMPRRMYFIEDSQATFEGRDLGRPVHLRANPAIGSVSLPARGVLAVRGAMWRIRDAVELDRTREEVAAA